MLALKKNDLLRVVHSFCTYVLTNQFESLFILGIQYLTRSLFVRLTPTHLVIGDCHRRSVHGLQLAGGRD